MSSLPEGKFITSTNVMDSINNANLTEDYAKLINSYETTAILDKRSLSKISETISCRYVLHVKLIDQSVINKGFTKNAHLFGQVWDCKLGDVVWEATGKVSVDYNQTFDYRGHRMEIEEVVELASLMLINKLPGIIIPIPNYEIPPLER